MLIVTPFQNFRSKFYYTYATAYTNQKRRVYLIILIVTTLMLTYAAAYLYTNEHVYLIIPHVTLC